VSVRATTATASRVLRQLAHDKRTIALLLAVPCVLMLLLDQLFVGNPAVFQRVGVPMLGLFPLISMFLVTSITMLRERVSGTLERLLTMPIGKLDLLVGYATAFAVVAVAQASLVSVVGFGLLDLQVESSRVVVGLLAIANAVLGMALGLFVSAFAQTEFQAVQFMPAFVLPQLLLSGLLVSRTQMPGWLESVSSALPMTYAYDALARAAHDPSLGQPFVVDAAVTSAAIVLSLALGAATLRRRTA
jgi:ABC-2 type transport system permease protein